MNDGAKARIRARVRARRRDSAARRALTVAEGGAPLTQASVKENACSEAQNLLHHWHQLLLQLGLTPPFLPALFVPSSTEPDVSAIVAEGDCLLPALLSPEGAHLGEPAWTYASQGAQPDGPRFVPQNLLSAEALARADVILVPALSVDMRGTRLGQGGGWYDRALLHARPEAPRIAVVFDEDMSPEPLPLAPHDQSVHGILTPARAILFA